MKKRIARVSVRHNAKLAAAIYFVVSFPMALVMALVMFRSGGLSVGTVFFLPIFYLIFGYIFTALGAWVYNFVAARVGGFEFTAVEMPE